MASQGITDRIQGLVGRLSRREKLLVSGALAAFVLLVGTIVSISVQGSLRDKASRIEYKRQGLQQVVQLSSGFREARAEQERLERKLKGSQNVSLFSFMEDLGRGQGVTITNMTPRQPSTEGGITVQTVDVTLDGVRLDKLAGIINGIQRSPHMVKLTKLRVRRKFNNEESVDATLTVSTYSLANT